MFGLVREVGPGWWLVAIAATTLGDLLDLAVSPAGTLALATGLLGTAILFAVGYALLRRMAGFAAPFRPEPALGRYALFEAGLVVAFGLVSHLVFLAVGSAMATLATAWLVAFLVAGAWGVATIRLAGIPAALACGTRFSGLRGVVAVTRGHAAPLAACFAQAILPFVAIHLALLLLATRLRLPPSALAAIAVIDGLVSAIALLLGLALSMAAWRIDARRFP